MTSPLLLLIALILTTATQLRVGETPIGPGELLIAAWLLQAAMGLIQRHGQVAVVTPQVRPVAVFWVCNWALLIAGAIGAYRLDLLASSRAAHDALAFVLVAAFCLLVSLQPAMARPERLARTMLLAVTLCATGIMIAAEITDRVGPVSLWFGERLAGWAKNPNQLVQLIVPLPFLSLYLAGRDRTPGRRLAALACLPVVVVFGLLTRSDAVILGWVAGLGTTLCMGLVLLTLAPGRTRAESMVLRAVVPAVALVAVLGLAWWLSGDALRLLNKMAATGGQGAVRLVLWANGAQAVTESPLTGFGPGSHSGFFAPFQGKEAHNSLIDWASSTGLLGLALLIGLLLVFLRHVWRARSPLLTGAFVTLLVFMQFDFALRQPIFWFWLLLLPGLGCQASTRFAPAQARMTLAAAS